MPLAKQKFTRAKPEGGKKKKDIVFKAESEMEDIERSILGGWSKGEEEERRRRGAGHVH